jgi:hypothetical protein
VRPPVLILDGREKWRPVPVETIETAGATIGGKRADVEHLPAAGGSIDLPAILTQPDAPLVGYHRAVKGGGLVWHQFWTWWLYNPKTYAGSQHSGGEKREFWRVSLHEKRPKVFVARDSHANYFAPERDVTDVADGRGPVLGDIEWREFGPWASWPGRWGHSSNSPGPLSSRRAWVAPHAWHGQARG